MEPPSVAGLIADWEEGEEFRDSDCRYTVNDWAYLVEHQEQVWGYVDWPKLEPFSYIGPEPECKPEPRSENEGGLWVFDYEKCEWNKNQWWMSDQLEKIIQDCPDPENKISDKGMSNGTTKLKTTNCTWQHGGFYNQVYVEEWADPVPLIQDNKIIGPDGQIFKILED